MIIYDHDYDISNCGKYIWFMYLYSEKAQKPAARICPVVFYTNFMRSSCWCSTEMTAHGKALNLSTSSEQTIPMTDPWCCYSNGVPWIPSMYPLYVSIYTSTMDPMGLENVQFFEPRCAVFVSTEPKPIFCVRIQDQKWPCQTPWKLSLPAAVKTQDDRKLAEKRTIPGKCQPRINKTLLIRRRK